MNVLTSDLLPGDIINYDGTSTETVVSIEIPEYPCTVARVEVVRHTYGHHVRTFFLSGKSVTHEVTR